MKLLGAVLILTVLLLSACEAATRKPYGIKNYSNFCYNSAIIQNVRALLPVNRAVLTEVSNGSSLQQVCMARVFGKLQTAKEPIRMSNDFYPSFKMSVHEEQLSIDPGRPDDASVFFQWLLNYALPPVVKDLFAVDIVEEHYFKDIKFATRTNEGYFAEVHFGLANEDEKLDDIPDIDLEAYLNVPRSHYEQNCEVTLTEDCIKSVQELASEGARFEERVNTVEHRFWRTPKGPLLAIEAHRHNYNRRSTRNKKRPALKYKPTMTVRGEVYHLNGLVIYYPGHYYAITRTAVFTGIGDEVTEEWYELNDSVTESIRLKDVLDHQDDAAWLFYVKADEQQEWINHADVGDSYYTPDIPKVIEQVYKVNRETLAKFKNFDVIKERTKLFVSSERNSKDKNLSTNESKSDRKRSNFLYKATEEKESLQRRDYMTDKQFQVFLAASQKDNDETDISRYMSKQGVSERDTGNTLDFESDEHSKRKTETDNKIDNIYNSRLFNSDSDSHDGVALWSSTIAKHVRRDPTYTSKKILEPSNEDEDEQKEKKEEESNVRMGDRSLNLGSSGSLYAVGIFDDEEGTTDKKGEFGEQYIIIPRKEESVEKSLAKKPALPLLGNRGQTSRGPTIEEKKKEEVGDLFNDLKQDYLSENAFQNLLKSGTLGGVEPQSVKSNHRDVLQLTSSSSSSSSERQKKIRPVRHQKRESPNSMDKRTTKTPPVVRKRQDNKKVTETVKDRPAVRKRHDNKKKFKTVKNPLKSKSDKPKSLNPFDDDDSSD